MKLEETMEEIQRLNKYVELLGSPDEFFVHMNGHRTELSLVLSSFSIANESETILAALKKQYPRKVHIYEVEVLKCPSCGKDLGYFMENGIGYCMECGQKIEFTAQKRTI